MKASVSFLFLGETLLIPHLFPIVEALAEKAGEVPIDLWVATSVHEELLGAWTEQFANVRLRRAPGFVKLSEFESGQNPPLPSKLRMLAGLAPRLVRVPVAVCAEQTSLWLPTILPLRTRFIKTSHGVGSMSARDDRRRLSAWRTLVPSELERSTYLERGMDPDRIIATGYVKAAFRQRTHARFVFPEKRPIILYTPHWQAHRSSWPQWGQEVVRTLVRQQRYNVILAPHQRLVETAPEVRSILTSAAEHAHVHCDLDTFATVDGSYTAMADIYVGDTSSQLLEFLMRPRPCIFLNPMAADWRENPSYAMWSCGEVVTELNDFLPAVTRAVDEHRHYAVIQRDYAERSLGDTSGMAASRAADEILFALHGAD
ncbi:MAG: hypothetical protein JWN69_868 [Alphaproteobacteria bacterium]|nr:hypothetical protein [Alphaproteobacteria bacterium]